MSRLGSHPFAVLLACTTLTLWCGDLRAGEGNLSNRILYEAPLNCPLREDFLKEVQRRLESTALQSEDNSVLRVSIRWNGDQVEGVLELTDAQGNKTERVLQDDNCRSLADALALAVALVLNPAGVVPASAPVPTPPQQPRKAPAPVPVKTEPWTATLGLSIDRLVGVLPEASWWPQFRADIFAPRSLRSQPSVRLALGYAQQSDYLVDQAKASFSFYSVRVAGCPLSLGVGESVSLRPCVTLDSGVLRGRGAEVSAPGSASRLWAAPGALANLRLAVASWGDVELEGGLFFPLRHTEFRFEPSPSVYRVAAVGGSLGIGLALRIP